jgi:hypothetical protein
VGPASRQLLKDWKNSLLSSVAFVSFQASQLIKRRRIDRVAMEEAAGGGGEDAEVYCAVGKDAGREWRANLRWVLANFPRSQDGSRLVLVLAHVHRPPRLINMSNVFSHPHRFHILE